MKITLENIKFRTEFQNGDIGYITWMHGDNYDFGLSFEIYVAQTLSDFYKNMDHSKERVWIAEHNEKIIGTIALKNTDGQAQLRYFLIDDEYRGIGLGNKMMTLFLDFMKAKGYRSSFLLTEEQLKTATHLYEKFGYRFVAANETDFGLVERRYELHLKD